MHRLPAVAAIVLAAVLGTAPSAGAHAADPHYLTRVDRIEPARGITVQVLNRSDRLLLTNRSGRDVLIRGYEGEPYARVLADGTVQQNERSPAAALNEDRYAEVDVPSSADADAPPRWRTISGTGRFEWHDHRMHWMSRSRPPQVRDPDARQRIFGWSVPLTVDGRRGEIAGTLFWTPLPGGKVSALQVGGGAVLVLVLCGGLLLVHRRRLHRPEAEAW